MLPIVKGQVKIVWPSRGLGGTERARRPTGLTATGGTAAAYFVYDAAGNMTSAQEAVEETVYFAYDALSRQTGQQFATGGAAYYTQDASAG